MRKLAVIPVVVMIVLTAFTVCVAAPQVSVRNATDHNMKIQIASKSTPSPDNWRALAPGKTVRLSFKRGDRIICRSHDDYFMCPDYVVGTNLKLRVEEMHIYPSTGGHHETRLMLVADQ